MSALLLVLEALFCLKIAWNLLVPYELARRSLRTGGKRAKGISLAPAVEIVLLLFVLAASFAADYASSLQSPRRVATWGVALIVASYVHMMVAGALAGWIAAAIKRRRRAE